MFLDKIPYQTSLILRKAAVVGNAAMSKRPREYAFELDVAGLTNSNRRPILEGQEHSRHQSIVAASWNMYEQAMSGNLGGYDDEKRKLG